MPEFSTKWPFTLKHIMWLKVVVFIFLHYLRRLFGLFSLTVYITVAIKLKQLLFYLGMPCCNQETIVLNIGFSLHCQILNFFNSYPWVNLYFIFFRYYFHCLFAVSLCLCQVRFSQSEVVSAFYILCNLFKLALTQYSVFQGQVHKPLIYYKTTAGLTLGLFRSHQR